MASRAEQTLVKFRRAKDKVRTIEQQLENARLEAARAALSCVEVGVKRTPLAEEWGTNILQIDRMIARARAERK